MKTVFSNKMCAHVWAQQSQLGGRSDHMRFDGPTLYSYSTPIGFIPNGAKYGLVALLTSDSYSPTTSSTHMPAASTAVRGRRVWSVPQLGVSATACRDNLAYLQHEYTHEIESLMRVPCDSFRVSEYRTSGEFEDAPSQAHRMLREMAADIAAFMRTFDVAGPVLTPDESAAKIIARRDRLMADPKRKAEREAREALNRARAAARAAKDYADSQEAIADWRAGRVVLQCVSDEHGGALLRVSMDATRVQTSWGAEVPVADARRVLSFYDYCREHGKVISDADDMPQSRKLGHFQLDKINADGSIVAGCHTINAPEIEGLRFGLSLHTEI